MLSEVSCRIDLPSVHRPSPTARQRKTLCGMRDALVHARTQLINTVRGWLRGEGQAVRSGAVESFPARVQALAAATPLPTYVVRQLEAITQLSAQIAAADRELATLARTDPVTRRLMTVPGVGPTTAVRFVAAVDAVTRFPSAHALESYLGLTPGEHSSSDRRRRTSITKAGPVGAALVFDSSGVGGAPDPAPQSAAGLGRRGHPAARGAHRHRGLGAQTRRDSLRALARRDDLRALARGGLTPRPGAAAHGMSGTSCPDDG